MKRISFGSLALLLTLNVGELSFAQGTSEIGKLRATQSMNVNSMNDAQNLFAQYALKSKDNNLKNVEILNSIHVKGLAATSENVKSLRSLLVSNINDDEKIVLIRILGRQYTYDDKTGMNSQILQELKNKINSSQKAVARSGVLTFSRLGYFVDTAEILKRAKNTKLIDTDEYFGELAHVLPYAPASAQYGLINKVKSEKNQYAADILAFTIQNSEIMKKLAPETKKEIYLILQASEPNFSFSIGEFSVTDSVRYTNWLHATAQLEVAMNNGNYQDAIFTRLNEPKIDPRKIIAFLSSNEGKLFMNTVKQRTSLDLLQQKIVLYSKQLPQNLIMRDFVQEITMIIKYL